MAQTNRDRVHRGLDLLLEGLKPFVERQFQAVYGDDWRSSAAATLRDAKDWHAGNAHLDVQALLILMWENWHNVFRPVLGHAERNLVSELRTVRNRDAHQEVFSTDDAYRALDSIQRLLQAVSAPEAAEVERAKADLLRLKFEEQSRQVTRRTASAPTEGRPQAGLPCWRELITPHPDVAAGRFEHAEFAADLNQVYRGEGEPEYRDPQEFYARTFITEGMRALLVDALRRLAGSGGDPVVELQTNLGGGKTHSMLALYHLFSGEPVSSLPGVEPLLHEAGASQPGSVRRAVLVGQALSPGIERAKPDGTVTRTLWGEMAWQLLGAQGFSYVADADREGVSPGSDVLVALFRTAGPSLILIDEWVSFLRQLYHVSHLPAGSFDANLTFAQALTEAARAVDHTLVVASLPASDIEIGGEGGRAALERLRNTFSRVAETWRPASTEEGFEIVRRRLFQPMPREAFPNRDAVIRAFSEVYRTQSQEFPSEAREGEYERRMRAAYPIHPELFARLYGDWSQLDKFQRTRGVLRLMAAVIHALWERQDGSLLILPATIPIDEPAVQNELTHYLDDPWIPVIETDVDGPNSLPLRLDRENPNLGRFSAARRVARTIYLGSAPKSGTANRGIDERNVKLGCVQPGESVATFGDALRRLTDGATHLYVDGSRYWYSTQPSVSRLAEDRAAQVDRDTVLEHIEKLLRASTARGDFARVHVCPQSTGDVPDDMEARLVVLKPAIPHTARDSASPARAEADRILRERGTSPRAYQNTLVFVAADRTRLGELERAVRSFLAWESICNERVELNLDPFQQRQAETKRDGAKTTVERRLPETYSWLLSPTATTVSAGQIDWSELRLSGNDPLAVRTSRKLAGEEMLLTGMAGIRLAHELNTIPLWRGDDVSVRQLWEDFCRYLYLPRLRDSSVLLGAISSGVSSLTWESESFAYAESKEEGTGRYRGLAAGRQIIPLLEGGSLLVRSDAARRQMDADEAARRAREEIASTGGMDTQSPGTSGTPPPVAPGAPAASPQTSAPRIIRRFHGSVRLNTLRLGRDASVIAEEIVQQLASLPGADVEVTLEISADVPEGVPEDVARSVTENAATLRFSNQGFEEW
jgi:predicted AAA+ superfamily ATPase